ncbi:MAG: response regulator [Bacteroidales bacterium]|nr:response regulator [Bacteroidales bacterium]
MKQNVKILYLDDNPMDRALIQDTLKMDRGFDVTETKSYLEFERIFKTKTFDLVLTDFNILGYEGLQVLDRVKEYDASIPVIIVTGTGTEEVAVEAMKKGASDYVLKTTNHIKRLPQTIRSVLEKIENNKKLQKIQLDLEENESSLRDLVNNTFDAIFISNEDGKYLYVNHRAVEISGYSEKELYKMRVLDLAPKNKEEEIERRIGDRFNGKNTLNIFESRLLNKSGVEIPVEIASASTIWRGIPAEIASVRDISERKKGEKALIEALEKARESDRLKSAFLAIMSHELRTPLNAIIGFSDLIKDGSISGDIFEYASIVNNSGIHLLNLVDELFDLSLIEAGRTKIEREEVVLQELLHDVHEMILIEQQKLKKTPVDIILNIPSNDTRQLIYTDISKLKQILLNLLKNALKFTSEGHIEYGYQINESNSGHSGFTFFVKDTGIGISEENKQVIFDLFRQIEDAYTREHGGAGIGLSVAKKLTDLLGGSIWIDSSYKKGAAFYFTIPDRKKKDSVSEDDLTTDKSEVSDKKLNTVLIVEDDDSSFQLMALLLKRMNLNIIRAISGKEALNICKRNPLIDLVFMDISIPEMDGYEATAAIKQVRSDIPIIAQTAHAISGDKEKALNAGCVDYLTKPIRRELLYKTIEKYGLVASKK